MGSFLNPGTIEFEEALNSEIYIDKSGLIENNQCRSPDTAEVYVYQSSPSFWKIYGRKYALCLL